MRLHTWLARGGHKAKVRMLHPSVWPVIARSAGCRFRTKTELNMLRTLQLGMTSRVLELWQLKAEAGRADARESAWKRTGIPHSRMEAAASLCRWAGHPARLSPEEHPWMAAILRWRDAMSEGPEPTSLGKGHRYGGSAGGTPRYNDSSAKPAGPAIGKISNTQGRSLADTSFGRREAWNLRIAEGNACHR